jgi:outer membrane lipoprotein-sorting protein
MSTNPAWDRAGSLPVPVADADARRMPELASLTDERPSIDALFTFMRDAELRFETLRMGIEEHAWTTRGEEIVASEISLRHPGAVRILTSTTMASEAEVNEGGARGETPAAYEAWVSDGTTVHTYTSSRKLGTRRPARPRVRGIADDRSLPGRSRFYVPRTQLPMESLAELFIHPAGYCQNVLSTGDCRVTGTAVVAGRQAIVVECAHPRSIERAADRPDFRIRLSVDRTDGVILRLEEWIGDQATRDAIVTGYVPNTPIPDSAFELRFPPGTTLIY